LPDAKEELANSKMEVENLSTRQLQQANFPLSRGDSVECYCEKERIKLALFEEKTVISCRNMEKEDQCKTDAKQNNVSTMQAMGGRANPFDAKGRRSFSREHSRDWGRCHCHLISQSRSFSNSESRDYWHKHHFSHCWKW
jgi:hypothetical protein